MLQNHKLLIDDQCPMCQLYGEGFTRLGWIDSKTLAPYQNVEEDLACQIDMARARNEIALYSSESGKTIYGLDALLKILTGRSPMLKKVILFPPIYMALKQLYFLITYNRKVIAPESTPALGRACHPDDKPFYQWLFLVIATLFSIYPLTLFGEFLSSQGWWANQFGREIFIAVGQLIWQGTIVGVVFPNKTLKYLGNLATISLIGSLLLLSIFPLIHFDLLPPLLVLLSFGVIVGFILREHLRRASLLQLPYWVTGSWILYRVIVLILFF